MDGGSARATLDDCIKAVQGRLNYRRTCPQSARVLEKPSLNWPAAVVTCVRCHVPCTVTSCSPHPVNPGHQRTMRMPAQHSWCRHLTLFPMCQVSVVIASGYSDDITISSWTLSWYRDPQKIHDSSPFNYWVTYFKLHCVCCVYVGYGIIIIGSPTSSYIVCAVYM